MSTTDEYRYNDFTIARLSADKRGHHNNENAERKFRKNDFYAPKA